MEHTLKLFNKFTLSFYSYDTNHILSYPKGDISIPLIALFLGLCAFATLQRRKTNFLDNNQTTQMKGMAITGIIFFHFITKLFDFQSISYINIFANLGKIGVAVFLILSGFGLTRSYLTKGMQKHYLLQRLFRLLVPLWVISLVWICLDILLLKTHHSLTQVVLSFLGIVLNGSEVQNFDTNAWYISYTVFLYFIFYLIYRTKLSLFQKNMLLFLSTIIVELVSFLGFRLHLVSLTFWAVYSLCFPIGTLIGHSYDTLKSKLGNLQKYNKILLYGSVLILCAMNAQMIGLRNTFLLGFTIISFVLLVSIFDLFSGFLFFMGEISYELFLIHGSLMSKYDFILFRRPYYLTFFLYLTVIICIAYALKNFEKPLYVYSNSL